MFLNELLNCEYHYNGMIKIILFIRCDVSCRLLKRNEVIICNAQADLLLYYSQKSIYLIKNTNINKSWKYCENIVTKGEIACFEQSTFVTIFSEVVCCRGDKKRPYIYGKGLRLKRQLKTINLSWIGDWFQISPCSGQCNDRKRHFSKQETKESWDGRSCNFSNEDLKGSKGRKGSRW